MAALTPRTPLSLTSGTMPTCDAGTMWGKATLEGCAFGSGRSHGLKCTVQAARWQIQFG